VITLARRGKVRSRARIFGSAPDPEALRKNIVRLCFVIYWLLIFEGALRKWAFPSLASVLFFIRDPFLLLVYLMALRGPLPKGWRVLSFGCLVAALYCYLAGVQVLLGYSTLSVAAYGLHNYFLYFPLAWMIYTYFNAKDVQRLLRQTLFVAVPIAVLVAVQFVSSPDAVINKGTSQAGEGVFIVVEGIVRPYGTFTFVLGQSLFVSSLVAINFGNLASVPERRIVGGVLQVVCGVACLSMIFLSGSRTTFIMVGALLACTLATAFIIRGGGSRLRVLVIPVVLSVIAAVLFPVISPTAYDALVERQLMAVDAEGATEKRAANIFTEVFSKSDVPAMGYGMGIGTAGGSTLLIGEAVFLLSENEFLRIVQECGPFFGGFYILLRFALGLYLLIKCAKAAREHSYPMVFCLGGYAFILIVGLQITFEGTANGFAWIFTGIALAASKGPVLDAEILSREESEKWGGRNKAPRSWIRTTV